MADQSIRVTKRCYLVSSAVHPNLRSKLSRLFSIKLQRFCNAKVNAAAQKTSFPILYFWLFKDKLKTLYCKCWMIRWFCDCQIFLKLCSLKSWNLNFFGDFYTNLNNFGESFVFNIFVETEYLDLPIYCFLVLIQETMGSIHQFDKNVKDQ